MDEAIKTDLPIPEPAESRFSETQKGTANFSDGKLSLDMPESSEETIRRILSTYDLGRKLRTLRLRKKIALVDLGKHTGLSASMISQLENGKLLPTLPTLARIAMVFDVGLDYFFADSTRKKLFSVVRAGERIRFPERADSPAPNYFFECLAFSSQQKSLQAYLAEFPPRDASELNLHFHEGAEFVYVTDGALTIRYQDEEYELRCGDSVYFDSSEPHSYRSSGEDVARALVITTPPRI